MSVTESAKDIFRSLEESIKRDLKTSMDPACESLVEKPLKPAVERPKIVISIQDKDGLKQFRVYMVNYQKDSFLDKNRDYVVIDHCNLMASSNKQGAVKVSF